MKNFKRIATATALTAALGMGLAGCQDAAVTANSNLDRAADNFELLRVVNFYNTWTDTVVLQIIGFCSVQDQDTKFRVTCLNDDGTFSRRHMGRTPNLTYYLDQLEGAEVSTFQSRVVFRPQSIIPDIDFQGDASEIVNPSNQDG